MDDNTFIVSPMNQKVLLKPGETYDGEITIANPDSATKDFLYSVTVSPYTVVGSEYNANFLEETNRSQMVKWMKVYEPEGTLAPGEKKKIRFTISVPESAPAGGQYAALMVGPSEKSGNSSGISVQNVFTMASLVYAEVEGETIHAGEVLENKIPGFSTVVPIKVGALIRNEGNVHEEATIILEVSNLFTGEVILSNENGNGTHSEIILPETTKEIVYEVNNLPSVGVLNVKQTINYEGEVSVAEGKVMICPLWFMLLIAITIGATIICVAEIVKKHKRKRNVF